MGEHHRNGMALAKAAGMKMPPRGEQQIPLLALGDDYVCAGFVTLPGVDPEGNLVAMLAVDAGKYSQIAGAQIARFILGPLGKLPVERLKKMIDDAFAPKLDTEPEPEKAA